MNIGKRLVIDLDDTIIYQKYPLLGDFIPEAVATLTKLENNGWKCIMASCRNNPLIYKLPELREQNLNDVISLLREASLTKIEVDWGDKGKPLATWYIDDRGILFDGDWQEVISIVESDTEHRDPNKTRPTTIAIGIEGCVIDPQNNLIAGTNEALTYLSEKGHRIILTTIESNRFLHDSERDREEKLAFIKTFIKRNGIPYHWFDEGLTGKPVADYYVEPNMIPFKGSWPSILTRLESGI